MAVKSWCRFSNLEWSSCLTYSLCTIFQTIGRLCTGHPSSHRIARSTRWSIWFADVVNSFLKIRHGVPQWWWVFVEWVSSLLMSQSSKKFGPHINFLISGAISGILTWILISINFKAFEVNLPDKAQPPKTWRPPNLHTKMSIARDCD